MHKRRFSFRPQYFLYTYRFYYSVLIVHFCCTYKISTTHEIVKFVAIERSAILNCSKDYFTQFNVYCICTSCCMLRVCLCLSTITTRSMKCFAIFSQKTGTPRRDWPRNESVGVNCFSQGRNDILPSLGTESRTYNFTIANLRFYPLSCTANS